MDSITNLPETLDAISAVGFTGSMRPEDIKKGSKPEIKTVIHLPLRPAKQVQNHKFLCCDNAIISDTLSSE